MERIVLLAVAAAWAAVLLPPLLRSRMENRPGSSVTDFRRQLSTLQRTVPTRSMSPMRSMARPLAPSPSARSAAPGRPVQFPRAHHGPAHLGYERELSGRGDRSHADQSDVARRSDRDRLDVDPRDLRPTRDDRPARGDRYEREYRYDRDDRYEREYRYDRASRQPSRTAAHAPMHRGHREVVRRRRSNVLFVLVMATAVTLFLAATVKTSAMVYLFALSFVSLCGYCYKLAQLRQYEQGRTPDAHWYHAA